MNIEITVHDDDGEFVTTLCNIHSVEEAQERLNGFEYEYSEMITGQQDEQIRNHH